MKRIIAIVLILSMFTLYGANFLLAVIAVCEEEEAAVNAAQTNLNTCYAQNTTTTDTTLDADSTIIDTTLAPPPKAEATFIPCIPEIVLTTEEELTVVAEATPVAGPQAGSGDGICAINLGLTSILSPCLDINAGMTCSGYYAMQAGNAGVSCHYIAVGTNLGMGLIAMSTSCICGKWNYGN